MVLAKKFMVRTIKYLTGDALSVYLAKKPMGSIENHYVVYEPREKKVLRV